MLTKRMSAVFLQLYKKYDAPCMSNILKYLKSLKCEMLLVLSERELRVNKCLVFRPRYDESGKGSSLSRRVKRLIA